ADTPSVLDIAAEKSSVSSPTVSGADTFHIVKPGDTLWDIAYFYLGNPFRYPELAELSRIRDPDLIYPGDHVRIIRKDMERNPQ
ncbi:MAG TPA: LysM peptidoglycan-binding domain-containing protein, partial [bacterium]|nr:LysM peptidoglycan-binding domain-containing protein [bacterium]